MPKATQIEFLLAGVSNNSGNVLSNGQVFFYLAGTSLGSTKSTWSDSDKVTLTSNPITLSAGGTANVYGDGVYDIVIKDSAGTTVRTFTNLTFDTQTHTEQHTAAFMTGTTTGPANAYVLSISDYKANSYFSKMLLIVSFNITNTGASTLNLNGLGVQTIYKAGSVNVASGDIQANSIKLLLHDGSTGFFLVS